MQDDDLAMYKLGQLAAKRDLRGRSAIKGEVGYPAIAEKAVEAAYDSLEAGNTTHNINRAYAALDLQSNLDDDLGPAYQLGLYEGLRGRLRQLLYPGKSVHPRHHATKKKSTSQRDRKVDGAVMPTKKRAAQLDREIAAILDRRSARHHAVIRDAADAADADKERVIELLKQGDAGAREVARDLLLQRGIIKTGRVSRFDRIGESFSGPIYQINIGSRRYWMVYDPDSKWSSAASPLETIKIPGVGAVLDFSVTDALPPLSNPSLLKQQLHLANLRAKGLPESVLRRWVEKWWIE